MHVMLHSVPTALQQATADPPLCQSLLDTHGQVWVTLCGVIDPFSWVLVCTRFCLCPPRVCFLVLFKFWHLCGGVNGDFLQEGLCYTQVYCTQSSCLCSSPLMTHICRRHSNPFLAQPLWGFKVCVSPPTVSGGYGV